MKKKRKKKNSCAGVRKEEKKKKKKKVGMQVGKWGYMGKERKSSFSFFLFFGVTYSHVFIGHPLKKNYSARPIAAFFEHGYRLNIQLRF